MNTIKVPAGYQQIMPYLIVKNAPAFFTYMKTVFGATEKYKAMRDENTIAHAELQIGSSTIMFADATDQYKTQPASLFIYVFNADETYQKALAAGGISVMEVSDQSYGRSGGVLDPFGNTWWIASST